MSSLTFAEPTILVKGIAPSFSGNALIPVPSWTFDSDVDLWWQTLVEGWQEDPAADCIDTLEDGDLVIKPIRVTYKHTKDSVTAMFADANIAMSGVDTQDAYQSLIAEILDTFDTLSVEPILAPEAVAQFEILKNHIGRA